MTDREKVIKAIDICLGHGHCDDCGYRIKGGYSTMDCRRPMMRDALELLKEQETTDTRQARIFQCKECGYGIEDIFLTSEREYEMVPKYCPNCGRSVKWE